MPEVKAMDDRIRIVSFILKFLVAALVAIALLLYDEPEHKILWANITIRHLLIGVSFLILSSLIGLLIEVCTAADARKKKCRFGVTIGNLVVQALKIIAFVMIAVFQLKNSPNSCYFPVEREFYCYGAFFFWFCLLSVLICIIDFVLLVILCCRISDEINQESYKTLLDDTDIELA